MSAILYEDLLVARSRFAMAMRRTKGPPPRRRRLRSKEAIVDLDRHRAILAMHEKWLLDVDGALDGSHLADSDRRRAQRIARARIKGGDAAAGRCQCSEIAGVIRGSCDRKWLPPKKRGVLSE